MLIPKLHLKIRMTAPVTFPDESNWFLKKLYFYTETNMKKFYVYLPDMLSA